MNVSPAITDNLLFLHAEVAGQLDVLRAYFSSAGSSSGHNLIERSGYVYQLHHRIQAASLAEDSSQQAALEAAVQIARELDRIGIWVAIVSRRRPNYARGTSYHSRITCPSSMPFVRQ